MNDKDERMLTLSTWISGITLTIDHLDGRSRVLGINYIIDSRDTRYAGEVNVLKTLRKTLLNEYVKAVER